MNEKAKTYVVSFFNGDIKVFSKHDHSELLSVKQLHQDSIITDTLFLRNDTLNKKLVVTCSSLPNAELKVSEYTEANKKAHFNVIGSSNSEVNSVNDGF